jgi:hypothetical protein
MSVPRMVQCLAAVFFVLSTVMVGVSYLVSTPLTAVLFAVVYGTGIGAFQSLMMPMYVLGRARRVRACLRRTECTRGASVVACDCPETHIHSHTRTPTSSPHFMQGCGKFARK